jgi:CBS domain-containing membrane protein
MQEFLRYLVGDAMTYRPVTIEPETPLSEVALLFRQHDFNCLPVSQDGALVGIVTKLDLLKLLAFPAGTMIPPYEAIMRRPAHEVMTREPITVTPGTPLTGALQTMVRSGCRSLPVTIGALLVGIISREDVLRALSWASAGGNLPGRALVDDTVRRLPALAAETRGQ